MDQPWSAGAGWTSYALSNLNTPLTGTYLGTQVFSVHGTYVYTPAPGFHGTDTFTYTITDAAGSSSTATVTLTNDGTLALSSAYLLDDGAFINNGALIIDPSSVTFG